MGFFLLEHAGELRIIVLIDHRWIDGLTVLKAGYI